MTTVPEDPKRKDNWLRLTFEWVRDNSPRIVTGAAAVCAAVIAVCVMVLKVLEPSRAAAAGVAAGISFALILATVMTSDQLAAVTSRLSSVKIANFVLELGPYENAANRKTEVEGDEDSDRAINLYPLKNGLETNLAYLANRLLVIDPKYAYPTDLAKMFADMDPAKRLVPIYLSVGSLATEGYLTPDEARIGYDILGMRHSEFRTLSPGDRDVFLAGANAFVIDIRLRVFRKQVWMQLRRLGWTVADAERGQRDIVVSKTSGAQHQVIMVMTEEAKAGVVTLFSKRLASAEYVQDGGRRFLVVPPLFDEGKNDDDALLEGAHDGARVWTVTLSALLAWLGPA